MEAKEPDNEAERLRALLDYGVLDTPMEAQFEHVTRLIADICGTPIAAVSLVAEGRQWFKSEVGLGTRETPRSASICAHAILQDEVFVVPDTLEDSRFADNPLVAEDPNLRFYAGAVLRTDDGYPLGALCVMDTAPRELSKQQLDSLRVLATHVMGMFDLRKAMRIQEELNDKLAASLEQRRDMSAMVAHDLRTPISIVSMAAGMLREIDEPQVASVSARLERAARSMAKLTDDLVSFEKAGVLGDIDTLKIINLSETVANALDSFHDVAAHKKIALHGRLGDQAIQVMADVSRFEQVLSNLINNAIKFTEPGGSVVVELAQSGEAVILSVSDTGRGISPEHLQRIFEPFCRVGVPDVEGSGLGLAIVKRIVSAHGGEISAESRPGEGSCFTVRLPAM